MVGLQPQYVAQYKSICVAWEEEASGQKTTGRLEGGVCIVASPLVIPLNVSRAARPGLAQRGQKQFSYRQAVEEYLNQISVHL